MLRRSFIVSRRSAIRQYRASLFTLLSIRRDQAMPSSAPCFADIGISAAIAAAALLRWPSMIHEVAMGTAMHGLSVSAHTSGVADMLHLSSSPAWPITSTYCRADQSVCDAIDDEFERRINRLLIVSGAVDRMVGSGIARRRRHQCRASLLITCVGIKADRL